VAVDDKIYQIAGYPKLVQDSFTFSNTSYAYDPVTDSWSTMAPIPVAVADYGAVAVNVKIYIIGGAADRNC